MNNLKIIFFTVVIAILLGCTKNDSCDLNKAQNKLLALGKVQGRLIAKGGAVGQKVAGDIATDSGPVSELITDGKYQEACLLADELAKKHGLNLENELKDMITMEQLAQDGGKGSGTCSVADAARRQMELHSLLQKEVDAGRRSPEIFREFSDDTKGYAEMLLTDPSKACELFDHLQAKYGL